MRFYVLIPLLLPASVIFPQVKSESKGSHSTSYSKTVVSWRILTFLNKVHLRFDPEWGVWMVYFRLRLGIFPGFMSHLPFLFQSQTGRNKTVQNISCHTSCFQDSTEVFIAWSMSRWCAHWSLVSQSFYISTVLASIFFSDAPLVFSRKRIISNLGFMGLCFLQYIGISSYTWEMTLVLWLFSYPLNSNKNSLSCHLSSTRLRRSKGNSHMNMKGYGKIFSMLHHFETVL